MHIIYSYLFQHMKKKENKLQVLRGGSALAKLVYNSNNMKNCWLHGKLISN
jgi:hypothetical protein